ncbi:site-specific integrase [Streptomyces lunaelactis]|uniref:tyrosine-type recombinase/integrase n=1 Tax=Streptomyces lunaelactis TaxID=1535768 RepID=UPI001584E732|nr:site-specific integrase [Streptomyces lunaelactis]NUK36024.1 site-specific integrase [Streptomyces lunaelactis]NUK45381.1 site-specific integrase [Streptomyces lunaelactis]NUK58336.1 site-specific integrase [Streptomyces lunaelactis]NUK96032.1 site-specific integrase [Streptomyces lunaelactis]NUL33008.1 site-specific integrase [Streptomyces lunaelactis]
MAGHIQDRWYRTEPGPNGKVVKVKTQRYGVGLRYRARYIGPDGTEKSKSFPDRQKRLADQWLSQIESDMSRGQYIDPQAGRLTVRQHAERWLASLTMDPGTFVGTEQRIRLHVLPYLGNRTMGSLRPTHIREWLRKLQDAGVAPAYQRVIFANLGTMLTAAVDDRLIPDNPCRSSSVRAPKLDPRRIVPWPRERVLSVRSALPEKYRLLVDLAGGCGMRQGEVLGLAVDDVDFVEGVIHVLRQVKLIRNRPVFALPKGGKTRTVPLPESVARSLEEHITQQPPCAVTLPWRAVDGSPVTATMLFYRDGGRPVNRNDFNRHAWRSALDAAGVPHGRENGMHALRHFYASVLLDAGESVKAVSEYLGHHHPGFTLRTYTHLMPSSEKRTREAVDRAFDDGPDSDDGPTTAQ